MAAASEIDDSLVTRIPFVLRNAAERALARVKVGGRATGIAEIRRIRRNGIREERDIPA
jgi:hypothetical protein